MVKMLNENFTIIELMKHWSFITEHVFIFIHGTIHSCHVLRYLNNNIIVYTHHIMFNIFS